jgi:hypothetical protein
MDYKYKELCEAAIRYAKAKDRYHRGDAGEAPHEVETIKTELQEAEDNLIGIAITSTRQR